jgi:hypothetical protein
LPCLAHVLPRVKNYITGGPCAIHATDNDQKIRLGIFAYKKTKNDCKLWIHSRKIVNLQSKILEFADKETTYGPPELSSIVATISN